MRICLVYDCIYPHTVGGAERWYRDLAERLAAAGHEVTYLTRRQWPRGRDAGVPGVRVLAVTPAMELYVDGRRRIGPPLVFGLGVLAHLARHGRDYDVVHTASFPFFSLLAAAAVRRAAGYALVVDWHEIWTRAYWREYLGPAGGWVGWTVQRACVRVRQRALCFARMTARRLDEQGLHGQAEVLGGEYTGTHEPGPVRPPSDTVVFAGRHIPEKRVGELVPALARVRESAPEVRAVIFGDGPDRPQVARLVTAAGLDDVIELPGFVASSRIDEAMRDALCVVLPSRREGYGMVVIEAASWGTPSVVVAGPDNAATELVVEGVNGLVAPSSSAEDLAEAILEIRREGLALRTRTAEWFAANAPRMSMAASAERVAQVYAEL